LADGQTFFWQPRRGFERFWLWGCVNRVGPLTIIFWMKKVIGNDVEVLPSISHQQKIAWKSKACS